MIEPRSVVHDPEGLLDKLRPIFQSGWLTTGDVCSRLEQRVGDYLSRSVVTVSHGTAALQLLVRNLIPEGKKVIVPVNTFSATPAAPLLENRGIVFVDMDEEMQLDVDLVKKISDPDVGGVIAVHLAGWISSRWWELVDLCQERGWALIEDACQAMGAEKDGVPAGALGDAAAFSISPTKTVFTGQGGLAVVNDDALVGLLKQQRDNGKPTFGHDDVVLVSGNSKLSDVEAAIFLHQWGFAKSDTEKRRWNMQILTSLLPEIRFLQTDSSPNGYKHVAFVPDGLFFEHALKRHGVFRSGACYRMPLHKTECFAPYATGKYPVAEKLCAQHVGLPVNWQFGVEEMEKIAEAVKASMRDWKSR